MLESPFNALPQVGRCCRSLKIAWLSLGVPRAAEPKASPQNRSSGAAAGQRNCDRVTSPAGHSRWEPLQLEWPGLTQLQRLRLATQ